MIGYFDVRNLQQRVRRRRRVVTALLMQFFLQHLKAVVETLDGPQDVLALLGMVVVARGLQFFRVALSSLIQL